jgi:hypothetical protein
MQPPNICNLHPAAGRRLHALEAFTLVVRPFGWFLCPLRAPLTLLKRTSDRRGACVRSIEPFASTLAFARERGVGQDPFAVSYLERIPKSFLDLLRPTSMSGMSYCWTSPPKVELYTRCARCVGRRPLAAALSTNSKEEPPPLPTPSAMPCAQCGAEESPGNHHKSCACRAKGVRYCGADCQRKHWDVHRVSCGSRKGTAGGTSGEGAAAATAAVAAAANGAGASRTRRQTHIPEDPRPSTPSPIP